MIRVSVLFNAPYNIQVQESVCPDPGPQEVLVRTELSAISAGTELLLYRGQFPQDLSLDQNLPSLDQAVRYPLKYGYAVVGDVVLVGKDADPGWLNRRVAVFHPHESHFTAGESQLIPVPETVPAEAALFLPNMESAVNFVHDGRPLLGERVAVFGAGILGLLTVRLLAAFPIERLVVLDRFPGRRTLALDAGAGTVVDPDEPGAARAVLDALGGPADLVFELSGNPEALNLALAVTAFSGRVVIGSFYGAKRAPVDLGGTFHRSRIELISSQVSTLPPQLSGRWDKARRLGAAWPHLATLDPKALITHRFPIWEAARAYQLLDQEPEKALQVIFTYEPEQPEDPDALQRRRTGAA